MEKSVLRTRDNIGVRRRMHARAFVLAVAAALVGTASSVSASEDSLEGVPVLPVGQIYDRALGFVRTQNYPPYVSYIVTVRSNVKDRWLIEQFHSLCRTRDDRVVTDAKPLSTTNQGVNPYGFNVKLRGLAMKNAQNIDEPFGVPEMSPIFTFGLTSLHPSTSSIREYDISLVGTEEYRGRLVYHVALAPRSDPQHHRLRDLWVDSTNFGVLRLVSAGAFASGPATTVDWDVTYSIINGYWTIETESTTASMLLGGYAPPLNSYVRLPGAMTYHGVSYSFSNFAFPKQVSDLQFFEYKPSQAVQM